MKSKNKKTGLERPVLINLMVIFDVKVYYANLLLNNARPAPAKLSSVAGSGIA